MGTCKTSGSSQKKGLLPMGFSIFFFSKYPGFSNLKLDFFPIEKLLHETFFLANFIISELIMSEVSKDLRNIFFPKKPRILELEVGFFSTKKKFFQDFFLPENLFHLNFFSKKKKKKKKKKSTL